MVLDTCQGWQRIVSRLCLNCLQFILALFTIISYNSNDMHEEIENYETFPL